MDALGIVAIILAVAATVLSFIFIVPDKKRNRLPGFFKFVHDLFNFKFLIIEKILQAVYICATIYMILYGFFNIFRFVDNPWTRETTWIGWVGLLIMLLGPVAIRLAYELLMMFVLVVKNTTQINNKLGTSYAEKKTQAPAPVAPSFAAPEMPAPQAPVQPDGWFCTQCGHKNAASSSFCNSCGKAK